VLLVALVEDAREDVVVECVVRGQPLAQRIVFGELLGNVASVCPGRPVGAVVLRRGIACFVDGVAAAVWCEQPGLLLSVVPRVRLLMGGGEGSERDVGGETG